MVYIIQSLDWINQIRNRFICVQGGSQFTPMMPRKSIGLFIAEFRDKAHPWLPPKLANLHFDIVLSPFIFTCHIQREILLSLIDSKRIHVVFIIFWLIWHQTEVHSVLNQLQKCNYNPNLVWFKKFRYSSPCVQARDISLLSNRKEHGFPTITPGLWTKLNSVWFVIKRKLSVQSYSLQFGRKLKYSYQIVGIIFSLKRSYNEIPSH